MGVCWVVVGYKGISGGEGVYYGGVRQVAAKLHEFLRERVLQISFCNIQTESQTLGCSSQRV